MNNPRSQLRLCDFSVPAKLTVTAFLLLVGSGYLVAVYKIYLWHNAADGVPGLTVDDLRAVYHGLEKQQVTSQTKVTPSKMLREVSEGGKMRKHLVEGGDAATRALIGWLEEGAKADTFTKADLILPGDPSARQVIANQCVECHHSGGDAGEVPYARDAGSEPRFELVAKVATPREMVDQASGTVRIEPMSSRELVHVTHAHVLAIPLFTLIVAGLFLMTGLRPAIKMLAPLPMLACCVDFACWWLARPFEPAVYGILASGAVFGAVLGLQILCILASMWFGRKAVGGA